MPHRIRLKRPWSRELLPEGTLWRRSFHRPTGLGAGQKVWLVIEDLPTPGRLALNATALGSLPVTPHHGRFDVTARLEAHNVLEIILTGRSTPTASAADSPGGVFLEIDE